jgi:hypothetical protein
MRSMKRLGVLFAVFALCAIGAASASAENSEFTASAVGSINGIDLDDQVFNTGAGEVVCKKAVTSGTIASVAATNQHVTVNYSECTAFGFVGVHITPATYNFTAAKTVEHEGGIKTTLPNQADVESAITITVTKTLFTAHCSLVVGKQTLSSIDFANNGNNVIVTPTVTGIHSAGTGGVCGGTNTTGTYSGRSEVNRVSGGSVSFDN